MGARLSPAAGQCPLGGRASCSTSTKLDYRRKWKPLEERPLPAHLPPAVRQVVVNADDFGASSGINRGVIEAHERGLVTSTSLMVDRPAAAEAAEYGRRRPELAIGLHVEAEPQSRFLRWLGRREHRDDEAAEAVTVRRQLERFRRLVGADPTHLDSHHHVHRRERLRPIFLELAQELDVPLRHFTPGVEFCGEFYGHDGRGRPEPEAITPQALIALLENVSDGVTEVGSHPGYPNGFKTSYRAERVQEVRTLCDPAVRAAVDRLGIQLVSFRDVGSVWDADSGRRIGG
jgi:chitin disaccharide deacetylase